MTETGAQGERHVLGRFWRAGPVLALILTALLSAAKGGAASYLKGEITISAESMPTRTGHENSSHGYVEYRVLVTNRSSKNAHKVTLVLPGVSYSGSGHRISEVRQSALVGPNSAVTISLLQPPLPLAGNQIGISIDGKGQRDRVSCDDARHGTGSYSWSGRNCAAGVLVSRNVDQSIRNKAQSINIHGNNVQVYRSQIPVAQWSSNWLAYSRYEGLIVTGRDMQEMPPGALAAITQYVECGGNLLITGGDWREPDSWRRHRLDVSGEPTYFMGFGQCCVLNDSSPAGGAQWRQITQMWQQAHQPFSEHRGIDEANRLFPVIEDLQIPVRGLFLLILLFAVGIGPVNLIVLAKLRRRIWMLWTVPAISLVTCAAVFGYATFAEGWMGHSRGQTLTILDQATHRATTIGWAAFYSPLTPRGGLRFGYETELTPQISVNWGSFGGGGGTARTVDWTHDQHLAGGWISARVPAHFMVRKSQTRRERIVVRSSPTGLVAVNGLGADIRKLYVADGDGKIYSADDIIKGAEVPLVPKPGSGRAMAKAGALRSAYATNWAGNVDAFIGNPAKYLRPGTYIALLDGTPFIAEGLKGAKPRKSRSVVYGIMGGELKKKP